MSNEFESCTNCIHADDAEPLCILRLCKHAIAETKECYMPKVQSSFPQRHEDDYAYCTECDHVEMCRWYSMYGCEFKSRPSAQPEQRCVNCGRTANNGGWYEDGRTRCPIEEHYALPKDGYCHLWEKRKDWEDELISRQAAIDFFEERISANGYSNTALIAELNRCIGCLMRLPSAQPEQRWITSGKPMNSGTYLVTLRQKFEGEETYGVRIMRFIDGNWMLPKHFPEWINEEIEQEVLAWRELPEPWKEGEAE